MFWCKKIIRTRQLHSLFSCLSEQPSLSTSSALLLYTPTYVHYLQHGAHKALFTGFHTASKHSQSSYQILSSRRSKQSFLKRPSSCGFAVCIHSVNKTVYTDRNQYGIICSILTHLSSIYSPSCFTISEPNETETYEGMCGKQPLMCIHFFNYHSL